MLRVDLWIILATTLMAIAVVAIWAFSPHELGWRRRVWPMIAMGCGVTTFAGGAVWFYRQAPSPSVSADSHVPVNSNPAPSAEPAPEKPTAPAHADAGEPVSPRPASGASKTSLPVVDKPAPAPSRKATTDQLKRFFVTVSSLAELAGSAQNEKDVAAAQVKIAAADQEISSWIYSHMAGDYAVQKYRTRGFMRLSMVPWHGSSTDDSGVNARNNLMSVMLDRKANLQDMIGAATWDKD